MASSDWSSIWSAISKAKFDDGREPYTWANYSKMLPKYDFKGKRVLEFGCGTGINTLIMAQRGAKVTFVDYSREALDLVQKNLDRLGIDAELIHQDIFDFNERNRYDLVHSEGVVEHFLPPKRQEIVNIHADATKKGGKTLIIIPHLKNPPYRLGKKLANWLGCWIYGNEYPYTKKELVKRMEMAGLKPGKVIGGEFFFSLFFLFSPIALRSSRMLRKGVVNPARPWWVRMNYNNRLANRWGRVIGCVGEK
jgi:2-polyprenyl-3-methyl-5-hydroxy-6-metoxy-1,4-benzoquinol methylase